VVNFTIDKWVTATLSGDGNVDFQFDVPAGSGLGTSGALNVAKIAALGVDDVSDLGAIAELAFEAETNAGNRCGRQDQWASAHGGFNRFLFIGDGVEQLPFEPAPSARKWLQKHLIIAHSGIQHKSGDMQELVWSRYDAGDQSVINGLHTIRLATKMMADALQRDHRQLVVDALNEICKGVDLLDPSIHQPFRDTIEPMLADGSVMAWKALGAGGGGCAALLCNPMSLNLVHSKLSEVGWQIIDWEYDDSGLAAI
jgi:D-glycero-alpha-D-manno-heptose-7-phosphate kinase